MNEDILNELGFDQKSLELIFAYGLGINEDSRSNMRQSEVILFTLLKEGPLSFSDVLGYTSSSGEELVPRLKGLVQSGLVDNYICKRDELREEYSFYRLSSLGERLIYSLTSFLNPEVRVSQLNIFD